MAAWLGDTVETTLAVCSDLMPDDTIAGRRAVDAFFTGCAPDVPSAGEL